jgi:hypothetical protein
MEMKEVSRRQTGNRNCMEVWNIVEHTTCWVLPMFPSIECSLENEAALEICIKERIDISTIVQEQSSLLRPEEGRISISRRVKLLPNQQME